MPVRSESDFSALYSVYDDIAWLPESFESIYDLCREILFLIGDKPWCGPPRSAEPAVQCIAGLPDPSKKIQIVRGKWTGETEARNVGLEILRARGAPYCFLVDSDEVYDPDELREMMRFARERPETSCWHMEWDTYWKSPHYRIEPREAFRPVVFLKPGECRFVQNRLAEGRRHGMIPSHVGICHHLSYARSDEGILRKIQSFCHAAEVRDGWFEQVWKAWDADRSLRNLHSTHPEAYGRAVPVPVVDLPPVLRRRYTADNELPEGFERVRTLRISGRLSFATVIIPCKDGAELTRRCLDNLIDETEYPFEVIVVDNGSEDRTPEVLEEASRRARRRACRSFRTLRNPENFGFARAANQAIEMADGDHIVLLNNDVVVSRGWLTELVRVAEEDERLGLVGPMTNYAAPPQLVEDVPYRTVEEFHQFATQWAGAHGGAVVEVERVTGFCLLITRSLLERVGGFDEGYGLGFFEDDDLCLRAQQAGFRLAVAQAVFVHHDGSQTFRLLGIDPRDQLEMNFERFRRKWGSKADAWGVAADIGASDGKSGEGSRCTVEP